MFGRKKEEAKLTGKAKIIHDIQSITDGQTLRYKLGSQYFGGNAVAVVGLNPGHGEKKGDEGRKYQITIDVNGKVDPFGYFDNVNQMADFLIGRKGELITSN